MSFGREFATPDAYCREGFDRALKGLRFPAEVIEPLYLAFKEGHQAGDPRLQLRLISAVLDGVDWNWPWWEECATELDALGLWPLAWSTYWFSIPKPFDWDAIPIGRRLEYLSNTLSKFAYTAHSWAQKIDPAVRSVFYPTILTAAKCEATQYMVKKHKARVEAGDATALPPYFPMDHAVLMSEFIAPGHKRLISKYDD